MRSELKQCLRGRSRAIPFLFAGWFVIFSFILTTTPGAFSVVTEGTGSIRGTVTDAFGAPITSAQIYVDLITGEPCGGHGELNTAAVNATDGRFAFTGLAPGRHYVKTDNLNQSNYVNEWWAPSASTIHCSDAQSISLAADQLVDNINFQLEIGGSASGVVISDANSQTLEGMTINFSHYSSNQWEGWTRTLTDGSYNKKGLPAGDYRVRVTSLDTQNAAYASEYFDDEYDYNAAAAVSITANMNTPNIDFSLLAAASISGEVTGDSDGQAVPGSWVFCHDFLTDQWWSFGITDEYGFYTIKGLPPRSCRVQVVVWDTNYLQEFYDNTFERDLATPVEVTAGAQITGIDFGLASGSSISGTVVRSSDGVPIGAIEVVAFDILTGQWMANDYTDPAGFYTIRGLPHGNYRIEVNTCGSDFAHRYYDDTGDYAAATAVGVSAGSDTAGIDFSLVPDGKISGSVLRDADDEPIPDLQVTAESLSSYPWRCGAITQQDGSYTISGLSNGSYRLDVDTTNTNYAGEYFDDVVNRYLATPVEVTEGAETTGIGFGLATGGSISGTVKDAVSAQPIANVRVSVDSDILKFYDSVLTDDTGAYTLEGLPPGCYNTGANPNSASGYIAYHQEETLYLEPGESKTGVDFALDPGALTISGKVTAQGIAVAGAEVEYESEVSDIQQYSLTDPSGNYEFSNIAPGQASITVRPWGTNLAYKSKFINLPDDIGSLDMALDKQACVIGRVVDENGDGLPNVGVEVEPEPGEFDLEGETDGDGHFRVCNLPAGIAYVWVEPDIDSGYCSRSAGSFLDIKGAVNNQVGKIPLLPCTLVQGHFNYTGPARQCFNLDEVDIWSEGIGFDSEAEVESDGSYQILLPDGRHTVYFEMDEEDEFFYAYPVQVTITNGAIESGPGIMDVVYDGHPDAGTISGTVNKVNAADPEPSGNLIARILPAGYLDIATPENLLNAFHILESHLDGFGEYTLYPVPPGSYDVFLMLENEDETEIVTTTVLGSEKGIVVEPGSNISVSAFDYIYSPAIDGDVVDSYSGTVPGALIIMTDAGGDLAAVAETDENGHYVIYNPPAGTFNVEAHHPRYGGDPSTSITIPDIYNVDTLTLDYIARSALPGIDLITGRSGTLTWTDNSDNPFTGLFHEAKIVDYDGIAHDGGSHVVTVSYPNGGPTKELSFAYRIDDFSAVYEVWDGNIPQPLDPASYTGDYVYQVTDPEGDWTVAADYLDAAPLNPPDENSFSILGLESTTPTFSWDPVSGAAYYRVRLYSQDNSTLHRGYATVPPYTLPPGILETNTTYKYRVEAIRDHQWFEWDNAAKSDRERTVFETGPNEAEDPFIDLASLGVYTWNNPPVFGPVTFFWIRVHDVQGVPDNIDSVNVLLPDGTTTVNLYLDRQETATRGLYRGIYFGGTPSGPYQFSVFDKDGNSYVVSEDLSPNPVGFSPDETLVPALGSVIGDTRVSFDWDPVSGAAFYELKIYDKDFSKLGYIRTTDSEFILPPGLLKEGDLYHYRILSRREFPEENIDNESSSPPFGPDNGNTFTTTATHGDILNPPSLNLDNFGVAVWTAPHPATEELYYELNLSVMVSDADGVPANIERVEVTLPDGSMRILKYGDDPEWGFNYYLFEAYADSSLILDTTNSSGIYTFRVVDFDGNEVTAEDTLPDINANRLDWPTSVKPADGSIVYRTTPTISWEPVSEAKYYKVRIMSAFAYPTVHWSGELIDTHYTVPDEILTHGSTYGYRVYAYRNEIGSEIDFFSSSSSWHAKNRRFTIDTEDTDGDGMPDGWELLHFGDLTRDGNGDWDSDDLNDRDEYKKNTQPKDYDSDEDGVKDGLEVNRGTDPRDITSFTPPGTGAVRGTVLDAGGTPITGDQIEVQAIIGRSCEEWWNDVDSEFTHSSDGTYAIIGLAPGQYYLKTHNMNQPNLVNEWWAASGSAIDCAQAEIITVSEGVMLADTDFQLDLGGSISGRITDENGDGIAGIWVEAFTERCWSNWVGGENTDQDGNYTIYGLPSGDVFVHAWPNHQNYVEKWYDANGGNVDCNQAQAVLVIAGLNQPDIDMVLEKGPKRDDWWEVGVYNGVFGAGFDLLPGFNRFLESAVLTGPNDFNYEFDLENDVFDWLTECSYLIAWWHDFTTDINYGEYTLTLNFIDGHQEQYSRELLEAYPPQVDPATVDYTVNADGSIDFSWAMPDPEGYYHVRIYGPDGNRYYSSRIEKGLNNLHVSADDLRCMEIGQIYRFQVRSYDRAFPYNAHVRTPNIDLLYAPPSLTRRITWFDAKSWNGKLAIGFSVRPGSQRHVTRATVAGPSFDYAFNLTDDWVDASTETRFVKSWWKEFDASFQTGLYTLEVDYDDGYRETEVFDLQDADVTPIDPASMNAEILDDGSIRFWWDLPAGVSGQKYYLRVTSTDDTKVFNQSATYTDRSEDTVAFWELKALEHGQTYKWYVRSHDADLKKMIQSDGPWFEYDPFSIAPDGRIEGQITSDGQPVMGMRVRAFWNRCYKNFVAEAETDENGNYTISDVFVGDVYVQACPACSHQNYIEEWWDGPAGSGAGHCAEAAPVTVGDDQTVAGIDFALEPGPRHLDFFDVVVDNGNLFSNFDVLPGFRNLLTSATLSIPNPDRTEHPEYTFDLAGDKGTFGSECRYMEWWGRNFGAAQPADDGPYTLVLKFAGGYRETYTKTLQQAAVPAVAEISVLVNDDGSVDLTWNRQTGSDFYYQLSVRDNEDEEYFRVDLGWNVDHAHISADQLRCLRIGKDYRWRVHTYDKEFPIWNVTEVQAKSTVYSPSALANRIDFAAVTSVLGTLGLVFDTRPGSRDQLISASVSGPDEFNFDFDLTADWWDPSTETRPDYHFWYHEDPAWPHSYGDYIFNFNFDETGDGIVDATDSNIEKFRGIAGFGVQSSSMNAVVHEDGAMSFSWTLPIGVIGQEYEVIIRSEDGSLEYYRSPAVYNGNSATASFRNLRNLEHGQTYVWFIRAWEPWDRVTLEDSERIPFEYDPFILGLPRCEADFDSDLDVDGSNLAAFGQALTAGDGLADLNRDGLVNRDDLVIFAEDLGRTNCPVSP